MTALVWAAALGFALAGRYRLAARAPTEVTLTTWPPAVRISIDGEKQFAGSYVLTPVKLQLAAGRHRLSLSRDGYYAQTSEIEDVTGRKIDMNNVVLQRSTDQIFTPVEIEVAESESPVQVDVDDGFVSGETPLVLDDLLADAPHVLSIRTTVADKSTTIFRCRFTPPAPEPEAPPFKIRIKVAGTSYKATGCAKLKTKKAATPP